MILQNLRCGTGDVYLRTRSRPPSASCCIGVVRVVNDWVGSWGWYWFKTIFSGTGVGGWVGEGKKFFFYLCHKFCCCCSGVCVACSSRSTWKSFAFGNSLWEELLLGTHFSPLTHHLEILTTISFEMGTRNQCDQMVRLFLNIWSFATMKIRAKK